MGTYNKKIAESHAITVQNWFQNKWIQEHSVWYYEMVLEIGKGKWIQSKTGIRIIG